MLGGRGEDCNEEGAVQRCPARLCGASEVVAFDQTR